MTLEYYCEHCGNKEKQSEDGTRICVTETCAVSRRQRMEEFATGANRSDSSDKLDYEGFLSPIVLERYAQYMHDCRKLPGGKLRSSDNWQKGIPLTNYIKSMLRHVVDLWKLHRGYGITVTDSFTGKPVTKEQLLCAVLFNAMGYLHEVLVESVTRGKV